MPEPRQSYRLAGLAWLVVLVGIGLYEVYAIQSPTAPTLSAWVWWADAKLPWFRYAVLGGVGFLMWHFFWQRRRS